MSYRKITDIPPPKTGLFIGLNRRNPIPEIWSGGMYWLSVSPDAPQHFPFEDARMITDWAELPPLPAD